MHEANSTGSINSGSYSLTVADATKFRVNETIIIEVGGEDSVHGRGPPGLGTRGVGGQWPTQWYANAAAIQALPIQDGLNVCDSTTGRVWRCYNGTWNLFPIETNTTNKNYYYCWGRPIALRAKIVAISGNVLTLDIAAVNSTTNAKVYYDNFYSLYKLTLDPGEDYFTNGSAYPNTIGVDGFTGSEPVYAKFRQLTGYAQPLKIRLPKGLLAFSERWNIYGRDGLEIYGAGAGHSDSSWLYSLFNPFGSDSTVLYTPDGTSSAHVLIDNSGSINIHDLILKGSGRSEKFNLHFYQRDHLYATSFQVPTDYSSFLSTRSGFLIGTSGNAHIHNLKIQDPLQNCIEFQNSDDVTVENIEATHATGQETYAAQWWFVAASGDNRATFRNIYGYSKTTMPMLESFASPNTLFENFYLVNGMISSNSASNMTVHNGTIVQEADANPYWQDALNPTINFNGNANSGISEGCLVDNVHIITKPSLTGQKIRPGIFVTTRTVQNVTLRNSTYTYTGSAFPAYGLSAFNSNGTNITFDNLTVNAPNPGPPGSDATFWYAFPHAYLRQGTVKNCDIPVFRYNVECGDNTTIIGSGLNANNVRYPYCGTVLQSPFTKL